MTGYDAHSRMERLSFFCKISPAAPATAPPQPSPHHPECPVGKICVPAREGEQETEGGGRPGLRGGMPTRSPAPSLQVQPPRYHPQFPSPQRWLCCGPHKHRSWSLPNLHVTLPRSVSSAISTRIACTATRKCAKLSAKPHVQIVKL
jgi:hypothetical protein